MLLATLLSMQKTGLVTEIGKTQKASYSLSDNGRKRLISLAGFITKLEDFLKKCFSNER